MGIHFPLDDRWSKHWGSKSWCSLHHTSSLGWCFDVCKLCPFCSMHSAEYSSQTIQLLFYQSRKHFPSSIAVCQDAFRQTSGIQQCVFCRAVASSVVFCHQHHACSKTYIWQTHEHKCLPVPVMSLAVTHGFFFISLRILCFTLGGCPFLGGVATVLNCLRL